MKGAIGYF